MPDVRQHWRATQFQTTMQKMKASRIWLVTAALGSFVVAALHLVIIFVGARGYRFFDAPDLAVLAERGSPLPAVVTAGLVLVFTAWGLYALSGAGLFRPLPLLRPALTLIAAVYSLRGLVLIPELLGLIPAHLLSPRSTAFSAVALSIGAAHFAGLFTLVRQASSHKSRAA